MEIPRNLHHVPTDNGLMLDDVESFSPGLESSSSSLTSLSSTQNNSPILGLPLYTSEFSIEDTRLLLESLQVSFDLVQLPTGEAEAATPPHPSSSCSRNEYRLTSASYPATSSTSNPATPISTLLASDNLILGDNKPEMTNKKTICTRSRKGAIPPGSPSPTSLPYSNSKLKSKHSSSAATAADTATVTISGNPINQNDFFDTDVIINRSGEEETFLRGHCSRFAPYQMLAPDVSTGTNNPTYYQNQDTFAIANVYQTDDEVEEAEHHSQLQTASSSTGGHNNSGIIINTSGTACGGAPISAPFAQVPWMLPSGTEVKSDGFVHCSSNGNNNEGYSTFRRLSLPLSSPVPPQEPGIEQRRSQPNLPVSCEDRKGKNPQKTKKSFNSHHHSHKHPRSSIQQPVPFQYQQQHQHIPHPQHPQYHQYPQYPQHIPVSSPPHQHSHIQHHIQQSQPPCYTHSTNSSHFQSSPPALFPPIIASQFDPLYSIPMLPDSAPKE